MQRLYKQDKALREVFMNQQIYYTSFYTKLYEQYFHKCDMERIIGERTVVDRCKNCKKEEQIIPWAMQDNS